MEVIYIIYISITTSYVFLILGFILGFKRVKNDKEITPENNIRFSVIIPFRNEMQNLPALLESLGKIEYPKSHFEVLFVDDNSSDDSVKIISEEIASSGINYRILNSVRQTKSPKKDAIKTAISEANFEYIISTDADCILPNLWLNEFNNYIVKDSRDMVLGPVQLIHDHSFLQKFQALEVLSLQTATIGGFGLRIPFMANSANLCFKKSVFDELNDLRKDYHLATGDDIFLLEIFLKHKKEIGCLKSSNSIIRTQPAASWKALINQRIRWASKTSNYQLKRGKLIGFIVLMMNLSILTGIPLTILGLIKLSFLFGIFILKYLVDFWSMSLHVKGRNEYRIFSAYFTSSIIYPFLSVWIALKSLFGTYEWKGRIHHS